jgi:hypothetical protein
MRTDSFFQRSLLGLILFALAALPIAPCDALAQEFGGWDPGIQTVPARRLAIGFEVGQPLIAGLTVGYHFNQRYAAQAGVSALSGFTAFGGEARLNVLAYRVARPVPFLSAGFTQYYLSAEEGKTSPLAFQAAVGLDYTFPSSFSWGARFGYMKAVGSSSNSAVERYGINDAVEGATFSMSARYLF